MRAHFILFLSAFLLTGCSPVVTYYQAGAPVSLMEDALLDCQVAALQDAPIATQIRQGPPRYIPGRVYCHGGDNCYRGAGYFVSGEVYTVDTNARLRSDLTTRCMAREGFQRIELPRCAAGTSLPDLSTQTEVMPPLAEKSCIAETPDGRPKIISPTG